MAGRTGEGGRLDADTWRRIGVVLDSVSSLDLHAQRDAMLEACRAEGIPPEDVEPFLAAERRAVALPEQLDPSILEDALRGLATAAASSAPAAGDRLGPYEIVAPLGAGGMGEVYKARDTRLGRAVALKRLHADLATRPDGRLRFEREARAISGLNHPHICTLFDVGRQDEVDFLVMELVEGETLAARLQRGPLSLDEVLRYGAQISDALAAAHREGVVHRDLKPANIMLTRGGVKLLDFGLAALRTADAIDGISTGTVTEEGTVVGTPAYMSPEQLQGRPADARSDIFALGAVMHEMLTGRRTFDGSSPASIIAAVLERDPEPITKYRIDAPEVLAWAVRTCLAKDPEQRWQHAADVARQLRWIAVAPQAADPARPTGSPRRAAVAWIAAALVVAVLALLALAQGLWRGERQPLRPALVRFALDPPDGLAYDRMHRLSPDGSRLAFVTIDAREQRALWTRALDALVPQRLSGTEGASYPFWSPDGRFIAFFANNVLKKIDVATGAIETICNCDTGTGAGGTWNRDGVILFSKGLVISPLWRVAASGGLPVAVTPVPKADGSELDIVGTNNWPQFLPDGKHFLWLRGVQGAPGLDAGNIDTADTKRIIEFARGTATAPDWTRGWYAGGYLFFVRQRALMAQPFSLDGLELVGDPIRVVEQVEQTAPGRSFFDVAGSVLAYRQRSDDQSMRLVWFDRAGREIATLGDPTSYIGIALSGDGRHVLASTAASGLVRIDIASGIPTPVGVQGHSPVWAPGGQRFALSGGGQSGPVAGIGNLASADRVERLDMPVTGQAWPTDWSSDGRYIVGTVLHADTMLDVWAADVRTSPATVRYLIRAPGNQRDQRISPDGTWVAYASNERSSTYEIYVRPFPEGPGIWRVSTAGGRLPAWTPDGRELLYVAPDGTLMRAGVASGREFSAGPPQPLFRHEALRRGFSRDFPSGRPYDVADDRRVLIAVPVSDPPPAPIVIVLNWQALLEHPSTR